MLTLNRKKRQNLWKEIFLETKKKIGVGGKKSRRRRLSPICRLRPSRAKNKEKIVGENSPSPLLPNLPQV
jgi:hypothetical protein